MQIAWPLALSHCSACFKLSPPQQCGWPSDLSRYDSLNRYDVILRTCFCWLLIIVSCYSSWIPVSCAFRYSHGHYAGPLSFFWHHWKFGPVVLCNMFVTVLCLLLPDAPDSAIQHLRAQRSYCFLCQSCGAILLKDRWGTDSVVLHWFKQNIDVLSFNPVWKDLFSQNNLTLQHDNGKLSFPPNLVTLNPSICVSLYILLSQCS